MTPVGLAQLAAAERAYDGPFPADCGLDPAERVLRDLAEATAARRFFLARAKAALGFARRHRAQNRPDLAAMMLADALAYRRSYREWRRREAALRRLSGER